MKVVSGQLWSLMGSDRPRYTMRVTRVVGLKVYGTLAGGKAYSVSLSVFTHRRRGARLEEEANGTCVVHGHQYAAVQSNAMERRTASECVKEKSPRGMTPSGENEREALRLRDKEKLGLEEIAKRQGVSVDNVKARLRRAREALRDERMLGRTG